jgi:hypothetical protein
MATEHEIIGEEWAERASELADWAMDKLVNRKDVWGQYSVLTPAERRRQGRSYKAMTLPMKEKRGEDMVTIDKLTRHFASRHHRKPQIIGLHAKSRESTSRWFGIDIDLHNRDEVAAEDHARRNLNAALAWMRQLQDQGYDPMLFDSNGFGGYHLWVLFDQPAATTDVFAMVKSIVTGWESSGLDEEPETFPKQLRKGSLGAWFRLPGLHHTRHHYSRLWSGDEWLEDPWLTGHAAIDVMLDMYGGPPPPSAGGAGDKCQPRAVPSRRKKATVRRDFIRSGKATVCVDLDGVLAQRMTGPLAEIGPPIDGAVEFMRELSAVAEITILTSRLTGKTGAVRDELRAQIASWLETHAIPFDSVHSGAGKPVAHAYIDDRAVSCRPEDDGLAAFNSAMIQLKTLL